MRLIYKRTIVDRLRRLVDDAQPGRQIEAIVLSDAEYREYQAWCQERSFPPEGYETGWRPLHGGAFFDGIPVFKSSQVAPEYRDRQGC